MQGLATGRIVPSSATERHLDGCLGCRACERVCPAQVPYGSLIDAGRTLLAGQRPARLRPSRVVSAMLSRRVLRRWFATLLRLHAASGLQRPSAVSDCSAKAGWRGSNPCCPHRCRRRRHPRHGRPPKRAATS